MTTAFEEATAALVASAADDRAIRTASEQVNLAVVRRLIEHGFNRGDLAGLEQLLDPQYLEHQPLAPGVPSDGRAVRETILSLRAGFPDLHLSIEQMDAIDDRVWLRVRAHGTHQGPFMGNLPTGRKIDIDVIDVVRLRNGRILEHWGVPDHLAAMEQLGLLP